MHTEGTFKEDRAREDYIKSMITETKMILEMKGQDKMIIRNVMNFFFCSNHLDAVRLEDNERRFAPFVTAQKDKQSMIDQGMDSDYFRRLWTWLRDQQGFAAINYYLRNFTIPEEFDPTLGAQKAPKTSTHREVVLESMSPIQLCIEEAIKDGEKGFLNGWISSARLKEVYHAETGGKTIPNKIMANYITGMGYKIAGRFRPHPTESNAAKTTLYRKNNLPIWDDVNGDYRRDQGYEATPAPVAGNQMPT